MRKTAAGPPAAFVGHEREFFELNVVVADAVHSRLAP
jgi:hypothetical protein